MCNYSIGKTISSSSIKAWIRLVCDFIKIYIQFGKMIGQFWKFSKSSFFQHLMRTVQSNTNIPIQHVISSFNPIKIVTITVRETNNFNFKNIYIFFIIGRRQIRLHYYFIFKNNFFFTEIIFKPFI